MSMDFLSGVITPIATAGIVVAGSAFVGPMISNTWKNRERQIELELKERELKNTFVSEVSETIMSIIVAVMKLEEWLSKNTGETNLSENLYSDRNIEYRKFLVKSHIIQSRIRAFFIHQQTPEQMEKSKSLLKKWNSLLDFVKFVVLLSDFQENDKREKYINNPVPIDRWKIDELLTLSTNEYNEEHKKLEGTEDFKHMLYEKKIEAWYEVKHAIVSRKNEVVDLIIDINIPLYSPGNKSKGELILDIDDETWNEIERFRTDERLANKGDAVVKLIKKGLGG